MLTEGGLIVFISEMTMSTNLEILEEAWEQEVDRRESLLDSASATDVTGIAALRRLRSRLAR